MEEIDCRIDEILFASAHGRFMTLRCTLDGTQTQIVMKGQGILVEGQRVRVRGSWDEDDKGRFFAQQKLHLDLDFDQQTAIRFLRCGCFGIGSRTVEHIVQSFDSVELFDEAMADPRHLRIPSVPQSVLPAVAAYWNRERGFLHLSKVYFNHDTVPPIAIGRLANALGRESFRLPDAPHLIYSAPGLSSRDVEILAAPFADNEQLKALHLIMQFLRRVTHDGHTGTPIHRVEQLLRKRLQYTRDQTATVIDAFTTGPHSLLVVNNDLVFPHYTADCELEIARRLRQMLDEPFNPPHDLDRVIGEMAQDLGFTLSEEQHAAVRMIASARVSVLTGGPGCGKTATLSVLLRVLHYYQRETALAAPTGKAAQRAEESTGHPASTLHRLLGISDPSQIPQPLAGDVLVIDEASMIDVSLMLSIMRALTPFHQLVLVGDVDQLPSIGPGAVLRDLIDSWLVPVARLTKVFRQAEGSLIITNANRIKHGEPIINGGSPQNADFVVLHEGNVARLRAILDDPADQRDRRIANVCAKLIEQLVCTRLPSLNFDPIRDIWVLSPVRKGPCGVNAFNTRLQRFLRPDPKELLRYKNTEYALGDRVIQVRNNNDLGIYNGDTGLISKIDRRRHAIEVDFYGGRTVLLPTDELDHLELAYAITVHKSQGSQMPVVIVPMIPSFGIMLQRNLFYTAVTRAKRLVVVVGLQAAISAAIANNSSVQRYTGLSDWLVHPPEWMDS